METKTIETIAVNGKSMLELFLEKSADTQSLACFLLCILLIIGIVLVVRYCAKAIHYVSEKNAASLNKLSDAIRLNDQTNKEILLELKETKHNLSTQIMEIKKK